MKQREVLDNRRRQLTYFTSCNAGTCNCRGFRPVINNEDETVERRASRAERENEYAPMTRDLEILRCEEVIECRFCGHSITFHAEPLKNISEEELDTYMDRISDLQLCCAELTEIDPGNESLQTIYTTMQVLLKSLRTLKPIEVPHMGKPNFEPESLSSYLSVKKFIATRPVDNSEKQRLAEIGTLFLTEMNYWKLEGYQKLAECLSQPLGQRAYRLLYYRMDYYVNMPCKYTSFKQYQTVDIFGEKFTITFCDYLINTLNLEDYTPFGLSESDLEENSDELINFAKELKDWIETEKSASEAVSNNRRKESINYSTDDIVLKYVKRRKPTDHSESSSPREPSMSPIEDTDGPRRRKKEPTSSQPSTSNAHKKSPETEESLPLLRSLIRAIKMDNDLDAVEPKTKVEFEALNTEVSRGLSALREEESGLIEFRVIGNDLDPFLKHEQLAQLVELQNLFGAQLPKMPKDYLTRLIFDSRHQNMVILKRDVGVIGGICFRPFPSRGFVEIVFCAITAMEQVKGYGTHLMNHCKDYMIRNKIYHMLTFADEFAIGYFTKQGFSDKLEINQPVYQGWIKEYEGATLMGCHLHPQISYTKFPDFSRGIQALHCGYKLENGCESRGKVYGGLEHMFHSPPLLAVSRIPGTDSLKMSKKSCYQLDERDDHLETKASSILKKLNADKNAWPFANPVDKKEVPEYYDFTKHPIDLKTMHEKLKRKSYHHQHLFIADLTRMFQNCYSFNASNTVYYKMAYKLNEYALKLLKSSFPDSTFYPDLPSQKPN
ncbi:CBN-PCAF-1 protein [Caenorhabditis brenneri]|uniref:CBN-PCAF-1 protein n=1 Tax=Caenorhabditis brenneri TaxID=135651 RepID=G0PD81_CAEBE|nr:CBN-PCAF-1 protein [Caenorhabditis brenneri]